MSEDRQNTALSTMDKEMADMDDISDGLVSGIMEQTAMNLDELLQSICRWDSEERAMSEGNDESSADSYTQQKVQQHLEKFFAMRRVFAEHRADKENEATYSGDSETEISHAATAMDKDVRTQQSTSKEKKPVTKRFFKRIKFALKSGFGKMHSRKDEDISDEEEEDEEDTMEKETDSCSKEEIIETKAEEKITKSLIQPEKEEVSQVTEQDIRTQESIDNEATATKPAEKKFFKSLKTTLKKGFSIKTKPVDVEAEEDDATVEQQTSFGLEQLFIEDFEETKADEPITKGVIQSDISEKDEKEEEKENVQERVEVRIPETGSSSRLSTRSQESKEEALFASSSSSTRAIKEEPNMTISQVTEQDIRTQETIDNEASAEKPTKKKFFKSLKTTLRKGFSKNMNPVDEEAEEDDATVEQQTSFGLAQLFTEDFDTKADEQETDIQSHIFKKGEKEEKDVQEREEVRIPETGSSSRLSTRSQESEEEASSASSSFTTSTIKEEPMMTISQVTEQDIRTQEAINSDTKTEKPAKEKFFKGLKTALKKGFNKKTTPVAVEGEQEDDTVEQQTCFGLKKLLIEDFEESKADDQVVEIQPDISGKGEEEDTEETQADEQVVEIQSDISKKGEEGEEKENIQETVEVRIPETGSSSRLSTRSQESEEAASFASSSFTTSTINEEPNTTISQVTEQDIRTQESINSDAKTEKPAKNKFKRVKKDWKKCFSKKTALVSQSHEDEAPGSNLTCSPVKDQKEQYEAPAEQTSFALEQQFTEPLEERRAEAEDELVMEIHSASSSEEDGPTEFSQGDNEEAADQTPVPNMSPVIRRFFQSLTEEQWREVSEGVYNRDVKEKLIDMCVDLLKFISDSVIRNVLRSLSQLSTTSRTAILKSPISSEHLKKFFNYDVESSVESSLSQAVSDTIGADIPVSISPDFTEAIATEALDVVNPVLSVAIKASVVKGSSSAVSPTSSQVSKDRAGKKTLAGAIKTMKSILTGRGSLVKRRVLKQKTPEPHTEKEEPVWISFTARPMTQDSPSPLTSSTRKDPPLSEATTDEVCSTTSKKKKKTKRPLCMRLFCCCCCCCCHDDDE